MGLNLTVPVAAVVVPGACLEPTLDRHLLALAEVRPGDLGQAIPGHDVTTFTVPAPSSSGWPETARLRRVTGRYQGALHVRVSAASPGLSGSLTLESPGNEVTQNDVAIARNASSLTRADPISEVNDSVHTCPAVA